jgi:hypothetical protein
MIVLQGGKLRAVLGGSGGPLIVSAVYQTLVRVWEGMAILGTTNDSLETKCICCKSMRSVGATPGHLRARHRPHLKA